MDLFEKEDKLIPFWCYRCGHITHTYSSKLKGKDKWLCGNVQCKAEHVIPLETKERINNGKENTKQNTGRNDMGRRP